MKNAELLGKVWTPCTPGLRAGLAAAFLLAACVPPPSSAPDQTWVEIESADLLLTLEPGRVADGDLIPVAPGIAGYRLRKGESAAQARARLSRRSGVASVEDNVRIAIPEVQGPSTIYDAAGDRRVEAVLGSVGGGGPTPTPAPAFNSSVGGGGPTPSPGPTFAGSVGGGGSTPSPSPTFASFIGGGGPTPSPRPTFAGFVGGGDGPTPSPRPTFAAVVGGGGPTPSPKPTMPAFVGGGPDPGATPAPSGTPSLGSISGAPRSGATPVPALPGADLSEFLGFLPPTINDRLFSRQWHLSAIGVPEAWNVVAGLGFTPPTVAVLDTGIDVTHPDFAGRAKLGPSFVSGAATSADDHGHGTHVAGVIGAKSGNGIGIAAVAPEVRILGIKVLNSGGSGTLGSVVAGLFAAQAAGARIVNLSFGTPTRSSVLELAIAQIVATGVIVVAAAGNEGTDFPSYPAGFGGVVAVAAVDSAGNRASFSSGGPLVQVAAPGVDIVSLSRNSGYTIGSGTSQAAPIVSGAIATMLAFRPKLTASDSAEIIFRTGKPTSGFATETRRLDLTGALTAIR
jgi:hypothetical protein